VKIKGEGLTGKWGDRKIKKAEAHRVSGHVPVPHLSVPFPVEQAQQLPYHISARISSLFSGYPTSK
jgi:hypothetical protein